MSPSGDTNPRSVGQSGTLGLVGRQRRSVQLEDVLGAADALVDAGLKPTIERVRQKIGRGSPNTVSPMLDVWFSTLGQRLKGVPSVADEEARKLPLEVVQIAQKFWDLASHNARQAQIQQAEATRRELEMQQAALEARELHLQQREAAFEETRQRLDAALASSQQEREALARQLSDQAAIAQEQAAEASRRRRVLETEVARLNAAIVQLQTDKDQLRSQHAVALAAQERDARESEERHIERHVATERRLLADVDRAREETKQVLAAAAKERSARTQSDQALAEQRDQAAAELTAVRSAAATDQSASNARLQEALALHQREMQAHEETRRLLAQALTAQMHAPSAPAERVPPTTAAAKRARKPAR
jgi:chromosome segregation ATPase